jgi:hypothetical protein
MISAARPVRLLLAKVPACKKGLFEPDRLGTNIGKTQQKDCMSTQDHRSNKPDSHIDMTMIIITNYSRNGCWTELVWVSSMRSRIIHATKGAAFDAYDPSVAHLDIDWGAA